jgi:hypothetical protein
MAKGLTSLQYAAAIIKIAKADAGKQSALQTGMLIAAINRLARSVAHTDAIAEEIEADEASLAKRANRDDAPAPRGETGDEATEEKSDE